ncbi:MAG TPA: anhydro-N-acetylmuramic acid kinase [Roseiarcus sp.]|nr:anhydro-N-acetylmuramic acid kinase [Roseiarcus sp.]
MLALGLNSGSSFDGIDVVLVDIEIGQDGLLRRPRFIAGKTVAWPEKIAGQVLASFENKLSIFELCRLNYVAGALYAEAARSLMRETGTAAEALSVIGFDGQTIYQEPADQSRMARFADDEDLVGRWLDGPYPCGLQIAEPSIVAAACDATVVTQFRPVEHALGGSGAPLMQFLDFVAFRDIGPILTLNIGGIANCQLADQDRRRMMAFDTGPGNVMLDHAARALLGKPYDADGAAAARGKVQQPMLARLMEHDFFLRKPPRSAWRLDFGSAFADRQIAENRNLAPEDLLATFTEFTAASIARSIQDHIPILREITTLVASGGGVRNKTLLERLRQRLPSGLRLTTSDEFGIPAQYKEAIKFATLALAAELHLANNIPAASGASRFAILGKLVAAPRLARGVER